MSRINKQLNESNGIIYTSAFVETISKVDIPAVIYLKSAGCFDDKYINSTSDSWVFDYSGSRCYAHFRRDKISNRLTKYICFRYASAKCPAQIPDVLHAWSLATDHCITKSAFTFTVLKDYLETQEIDPRYFRPKNPLCRSIPRFHRRRLRRPRIYPSPAFPRLGHLSGNRPCSGSARKKHDQ